MQTVPGCHFIALADPQSAPLALYHGQRHRIVGGKDFQRQAVKIDAQPKLTPTRQDRREGFSRSWLGWFSGRRRKQRQ